MAKIEQATTAAIKLDEREIHEAVTAFVLRNKAAYGLKGKWKLDGSTGSKNLDDGTPTIEVALVKE
jgi:hypothetical protein